MRVDSVESQQSLVNTLMLSMDFEEVINILTLTHAEMFYSKQLSCHNFITIAEQLWFYVMNC